MATKTELAGRVALVTGSSRGIGAGIIAALDKAGAQCVVNYVADAQGVNQRDAEQVASGLKGARVVECDIGDDASVSRMMATVQADLGGLDILVNNAGILRDRTIRKMSPQEWDAVMRVNLTGTFNCIHHAAPILREGARIVNVSSVSGFLGMFGQANYASSKAGLVALTKVAARELAKQQVTANVVSPGFVDTELTRAMPQDVLQKMLEQVPAGRVGTIDDIVNAVLFLCSPKSSYITGQVLHVNGGLHMP